MPTRTQLARAAASSTSVLRRGSLPSPRRFHRRSASTYHRRGSQSPGPSPSHHRMSVQHTAALRRRRPSTPRARGERRFSSRFDHGGIYTKPLSDSIGLAHGSLLNRRTSGLRRHGSLTEAWRSRSRPRRQNTQLSPRASSQTRKRLKSQQELAELDSSASTDLRNPNLDHSGPHSPVREVDTPASDSRDPKSVQINGAVQSASYSEIKVDGFLLQDEAKVSVAAHDAPFVAVTVATRVTTHDNATSTPQRVEKSKFRAHSRSVQLPPKHMRNHTRKRQRCRCLLGSLRSKANMGETV